MPRRQLFYTYKPTTAERRAARKLCAAMVPMQFSAAGKAELVTMFDPIEPTLVGHLIADMARGTGYNRSPLSLVLDRKAYYLRKSHVYYCLNERVHDEFYACLTEVTNNG